MGGLFIYFSNFANKKIPEKKRHKSKKSHTHTLFFFSKKRRPYGCVRECDGAQAFGDVGVSVSRCTCGGQVFDVFLFSKYLVVLSFSL